MGNFSRNTFNEEKKFISVRLQQGVPLVDADWNELDDIRRNEIKTFIKHFIGNGIPDANGFKIVPENGNFYISKGLCIIDGSVVKNFATIRYTDQVLYQDESELAVSWEVEPLTHIEQIENNVEYLVYLDAWEREITSQVDADLIDERIGIETCTRIKLEWVVRIEGFTGTYLPTNIPEHHSFYPLAIIRKENEEILIISDLRVIHMVLAEMTSSTGVVSFPKNENTQFVSTTIDPSLGPGPIEVQLGIEQEHTKNIIMGDPNVFAYGVNEDRQIGALINQSDGTFQIGIKSGPRGIQATRVRWWAAKARFNKGEIVIPVGIFVKLEPQSISLNQGEIKQFVAIVTGTSNQGVSWKIEEGNTGGQIDSTGKYTAPKKFGTYHITATSVEDQTKGATATVYIKHITIAISPPTAVVHLKGKISFTVTVDGTIDKEVKWDASRGKISDGVYTAPNTSGDDLVTVTSIANPNKSAEAQISVKELTIEITPPDPTILVHSSEKFTLKMNGMPISTGVKWKNKLPLIGRINPETGDYLAQRVGEDVVTALYLDHEPATTSVHVRISL